MQSFWSSAANAGAMHKLAMYKCALQYVPSMLSSKVYHPVLVADNGPRSKHGNHAVTGVHTLQLPLNASSSMHQAQGIKRLKAADLKAEEEAHLATGNEDLASVGD